jgi:hypothetical protein
MKLHCFVCASPLYPDDRARDERLHSYYAQAQIDSMQGREVDLTFIQNGCEFPTQGFPFIRNPFPKNIAYNWLLCDYNCRGDYWMFLPEDCMVLPLGCSEIHKRDGRKCFSLSKDPKTVIAQIGIFRHLSPEVRALCDMNFLGKELACAILRGELDKNEFHCITPNWRRINDHPKLWGNELYEEMNHPDHPFDVNRTRTLPILQDYGLDGFKAKPKEIDAALMKIIDHQFALLRELADLGKSVISTYGPVLTELPCKI